MKKLYLINHSHTDIGYTAVQELIMQCHVDYIIQAIDIVSAELAEKGHCDFVWTCENYWQVKNFRENATPEQIELFERYVEAGYIDVVCHAPCSLAARMDTPMALSLANLPGTK